MLTMEIPGFGTLMLEYLVSDYTGTLSVDGKLLPGVREKLCQLAQLLSIHILTADTFGKAQEELQGIECKLCILSGENQDVQKEEYVNHLGREKVVALGNGNNDRRMLKVARLSIAVSQEEGCSIEAMMAAHIHTVNANIALGLLLNPNRCKATLRF